MHCKFCKSNANAKMNSAKIFCNMSDPIFFQILHESLKMFDLVLILSIWKIVCEPEYLILDRIPCCRTIMLVALNYSLTDDGLKYPKTVKFYRFINLNESRRSALFVCSFLKIHLYMYLKNSIVLGILECNSIYSATILYFKRSYLVSRDMNFCVELREWSYILVH